LAASFYSLGELYCDQGRYADAEGPAKHALAIMEKALGDSHPEVAASMNSLARVYRFEGRYPEAERLYRRSLAILEKAYGQNILTLRSS